MHPGTPGWVFCVLSKQSLVCSILKSRCFYIIHTLLTSRLISQIFDMSPVRRRAAGTQSQIERLGSVRSLRSSTLE